MHRSLAITSAAAVLLVAPASAHSTDRPAPRLELPASWYSVVEPYRYVEARRFERGWNRGADVVVADGEVRSPVSGRVRFAGVVAGRSVVTIQARVDGVAVVVTLTGLDQRKVDEGDPVRRGEVLGSGRGVHVGMYDRARRSRYLPVVGADAAAGASPVDRHPSPVADAIAARLLDAIRGDVGPQGSLSLFAPTAPTAPSALTARTLADAPLPASMGPSPTSGDGEALRSTSDAPAGDPGGNESLADEWSNDRLERDPSSPASVGRAPTHAEGAVARLMLDPVRSTFVGDAPTNVGRSDARSVHHTARDPRGGAHEGALPADSVDWSPGTPATLRDRAPSGGAGPQGPGVRSPMSPTKDSLVMSIPTEDTGTGIGTDQTRVIGVTPGEDAAIDPRWSIPAALGAIFTILVFAVRTRRRAVPVVHVPFAGPLPPLLPTMHPPPVRPVRTDGHSIVGGAPIAWPDTESGSTTHEPELLRHDADLLPERAAPPGPRVHDDRGGRDHPLPAADGSGRVLPDGN